MYDVTVRVSDGHGGIDTQALSVSVQNVPDGNAGILRQNSVVGTPACRASYKVGNELDFTFKVNLVAVVRVRAGDESVARKIVPTVLGAPGIAEIRLANENNAATGRHATVTDVDFSIGSVKAEVYFPAIRAKEEDER